MKRLLLFALLIVCVRSYGQKDSSNYLVGSTRFSELSNGYMVFTFSNPNTEIVIDKSKYKAFELKEMLDWFRKEKQNASKVKTVNDYLIYYNDIPYIKLSTHYERIQTIIELGKRKRR